ncbi:MAG: NAD(P)-dependent oxidoreductase [Pseudomonadota bacterium]|nr:NAD(P)-dependent oxidoreductase [Pseudomonadota bacterium]
MRTRHLFPTFIAVDETPPLVIGNAPQLEAKIRLLCKFAPLVEVVTDLRPADRPGWHAGARYLAGVSCGQAHDLIVGRPLVILDSCDAELNASLSAAAKAAGVPVNVPDNNALCSAYLGAIVDRAPVLVAISTGGAAPVLGQRLRARIESMLPAGFGRLASYLHRRRPWLRHLTPARRRRRNPRRRNPLRNVSQRRLPRASKWCCCRGGIRRSWRGLPISWWWKAPAPPSCPPQFLPLYRRHPSRMFWIQPDLPTPP